MVCAGVGFNKEEHVHADDGVASSTIECIQDERGHSLGELRVEEPKSFRLTTDLKLIVLPAANWKMEPH
jgi:hypothetical protein